MTYNDDEISFFDNSQQSFCPAYQENNFEDYQYDFLSTKVQTSFLKESLDKQKETSNSGGTTISDQETEERFYKTNSHTKYARDNLLRKIKVSYHTFIVLFLNNCILKEGIKGMLIKKIHGKQNQNVTLKFNKMLFEKTIQQFLSDSTNVSSKYTKDSYPQSELIKKLMSKSNALNFLFSMSYEEFYTKLFINADKEDIDEKFHSVLEDAPILNNLYFDDNKYEVTLKETARFKFIKHFYETKVRNKKQSRTTKE